MKDMGEDYEDGGNDIEFDLDDEIEKGVYISNTTRKNEYYFC